MPDRKYPKRPYLLVALTGGFGSGKSTVSAMVAERYPVLNSDLIAAEVIAGSDSVRMQIREAFGGAVFDSSGRLDRTALARVAFADDAHASKLNRIVHPPTIAEIESRAHGVARAGGVVIVESALVYEARLENHFDAVIAVVARQETVLRRAAEAGRFTEHDVLARLARQLAPEEKAARADIVLHNDGTMEELRGATTMALIVLEAIARKHAGA
ncbi:MAG: dephospho-CoA kinase [Ignavibacteriae bacterium]|nr:dephospho-CoA kinase [Ignavibacteriota bacterium]